MDKYFGRSGLEVFAIALACVAMSFTYGPAADRQQILALLRQAVELSDTYLDGSAQDRDAQLPSTETEQKAATDAHGLQQPCAGSAR
jgi:hypothetical protein